MLTAFVVSYAWLVVYPLVGWGSGTMWAAHLLAVVGLGACALASLWRQPRVALGFPACAALAALLSLAVALATAPAHLPRREMQFAAVTGAAHVLFFLACLRVMPAADAPEAEARRARRLLALLLGSFVVAQALAVWGPMGGEAASRPAGSLGNPNTLGAMAAASGLALAGLGGLGRKAFLVVLPVLPLVLVTRSRGAVAALAATLVLLAVRQRRWKLLAVVVLAVTATVLVPNPLAERIALLQPEHSFTRPFLWAAALESIAEHPLGLGPSMNQYVFPARAWDPEHPWLLHQRHSVGLTHNVLLTLTLEWGWLAGAAGVAFALWVAWACVGRDRAPDPLGSGAGLGAAVLAFELQVDGLEQHPVGFSLFLLLSAIVVARLAPRAPAGARGLALPGRVVAAVLLLALLALIAVGAWRVRGGLATRQAAEAVVAWEQGRAELGQARAALDRAQAALPGDELAARLRCDLEVAQVERLLEAGAPESAQLAAAEAARSALAQARAANPADPALARRVVDLENRLYWRTGRRAEWEERCLAALQAVLALDPLDVKTHWELAHFAQRSGRRELRDRQIELVFRLEPDYALAWSGLSQLYESEGELGRALHAAIRAEEALHNCAIKVRFPEPVSSAFYRTNLEAVDPAELRERIRSLRDRLYF